MTTKKKVSDEADKQAVDDGAVVDEAGADAPTEVEPEPSTPVEEPVGNPLATAQAILGIPSTGSMNHGTKMALRAWQRAHGLPATGALDERTKTAMHL